MHVYSGNASVRASRSGVYAAEKCARARRMAKRKLPVLAASVEGGEEGAQGSFGAWVGVAFLCALLAWLVLASLANMLAGAVFVRMPARVPDALEPMGMAASLAVFAVPHALAFFLSAAGSAYVVGKFGPLQTETAVRVGVGLLVVVGASVAAFSSPAAALLSAGVLLGLAYFAVRIGFRRGRPR